jgi:hypothetical protein
VTEQPKYQSRRQAREGGQKVALDRSHTIRIVDHSEASYKVKEDVLAIADHFPVLTNSFYPRVYQGAGQYHSPKLLAAFLTHLVKSTERVGVSSTMTPTAYKLMLPALRYLQEKQMPSLFLSPEFLKAVLATDFKDDIDWTTMALPYEHGVLVLPVDNPLSSVDGQVAYILWSRVRPGVYKPPMFSHLPNVDMKHTSMCFTALCPSTGTWYDSNLTSSYRPTLQLRNLFYTKPGDAPPDMTMNSVWDAPLEQSEAGFLEQMGVVLFGTMLALHARPDLLSRGKAEKVIPAKGDKPRKEFWSPNVIGRNYRLKREGPSTGSHASPRLHWRRGHFRQQPYGMGRAERKTIWLEPCLVAAPKEEVKNDNA